MEGKDMNNRKGFRKNRLRAGFTLVELVVAVAILAVLVTVTMFSLVSIRKQLRQKELDSKAETIYVSAMWRMTELRASGYEVLYQYTDGGNGVKKLGVVPVDADSNTELRDDTLCYIESSKTGGVTGEAASALLPVDSLDEELRSNQWHIEYDPESGSIYGVFYSESGDIPNDAGELDNLRIKKRRLAAGATVGYYGGDLSQIESTESLFPGITVENKEELTATFYCNNPTTNGKLTFEITLSDGTNSYKRTIKHDELTQVTARTYKYVWTLDSLKSDASRFYEQTEHKLACGTKLNITLKASSSDALVDDVIVDTATNSLFAYRKEMSSDTAVISYARHLQNLDSDSRVSSKITKAVQISDISFEDNINDDTDWYSLYGDDFKPIENDSLTSYDGQSSAGDSELSTAIYSLHIQNSDNTEAGLFRTFSGEIKNVTLTGTRIDKGSDVGGLVGKADGKLTVENCRVYLSAVMGDLDNIETAEAVEELEPQICGDTVGGLIGRSTASVSIKNSFAATVIKGNTYAGGLVGKVDGKLAAADIYADCYLVSKTTGGLFGTSSTDSSIEIENFYAVGYQSASVGEAGIVYGNIKSAKNGYSACSFTTTAGLTVYSTAKSGNMSNVYYLSGGNSVEGSSYISYEELSKNGTEKLGNEFTANSGDATYPYNLLEQGLSTYSYPRLSTLDHYGDWQAEFESGRLVYFERYADGSYGFEGANLSTLSNSKVAVGDGYAIAYTSETRPDASASVTVKYGKNEDSLTFTADTQYEVVYDNTTYCLVPLPKKVSNPTLDKSVESFYQKITVADDGGETEYYYNPYFAKTVTTNDKTPDAPSVIYVRTARQLYAMSLYYNKYADETLKSTFSQELDIDYSGYLWNEYSSSAIVRQAPIDGENGFVAAYNGNCHTITGISIESTAADTGLFGTVGSKGSLQNIFLTGRVGKESVSRRTNNGVAAYGSRDSSEIGALVGVNNGTITNCSVSGYSISYYGYNRNTVYVGGLVGENNGTISRCSSDASGIELAEHISYAYAGGFVGKNSGTIANCYTTGRISVLSAKSSTVWIGGFAGNNANGVTRKCYSAVALVSSGSSESYGFARIGGAVIDCRYLDGGTYSYAGEIYAYNASSNTFTKNGLAAGVMITGRELQNLNLSGFKKADSSKNHDETGTASDNYLYPAVVTANGKTVHFGNWPIQENIGSLGIFYWEYEDYGSNNGYHFSYLGTDNGEMISGNSLCTEHDDGGVVTSYGYGYFYKTDGVKPTFAASDTNLGSISREASEEIAEQMSGYTFVAYVTGEGSGKLHTTKYTQNVTWTLTYTDRTTGSSVYTYSVCPFFGNSISLDSLKLSGQTAVSTGNAKPGTSGNTYEIRSEAQLQFINWNSYKQTATYSIMSSNYSAESSDTATRTETTYDWWGRPSTKDVPYNIPVRDRYPYLLSGDPDSTPTKTLDLYWTQSHDLDAYAENGNKNVNFTPIGSFYDKSGNASADSTAYIAYFPYKYDGQSYTIKNIEIHSTCQAVGLFGVTAGAQLQNIVMYSEYGNTIEHNSNEANWYTLGGLAGLAGSRKSSATDTTESYFKNCTVSGYNIVDSHSNDPGWGGGCVGGLVGMTNMDIENCSAVNDINLKPTYNQGWKNLRVGGIAGVARATINSCYAGGSIVSNVTQNDSGNQSTMSIWVGGIAGGIVVRNTGNLSTLVGFCNRTLLVANCYSFVDMPAGPKTLGQTGYKHVRASMSIASNGEMLTPSNWFTKTGAIGVAARNVRIYNCYALESKISETTDYKNFKNYTSFNGTDIATLDTNSNKDHVYVYNNRSMYLSFDEMADAATLAGWLNTKQSNAVYDTWTTNAYRDSRDDTYTTPLSGNFSTVTVTEHGVSIDGKYSYPGTDSSLDGINYPFPTVLTQTDVFGNTVNVHYGAWPKSGIYWDETSVSLDLYSNRKAGDGGETVPLVSVKLRLYGSIRKTLTKNGITIRDDIGQILADGDIPFEVYSVSSYAEDSIGGYYIVTFRGIKEGIAVAIAEIDGYESDLTINVVNELIIDSSDGKISLKSGDEKEVEFTFYVNGDDGQRQIKPESGKLSWTVTIKSGDNAVICGDDSVTYDAANGILKINVIARLLEDTSMQEAHISVSCTYAYGSGEYEKMTQTADIIVEVESPDFVCLKLGDSANGYRFMHSYTDSDRRPIGNLSSDLTDGDGLYVRSEYTTVNAVNMSIFTFTVDGEELTPDSDGYVRRFSAESGQYETVAKIVLGEKTQSDNGYSYYSVSVTDYTLTSDAILSARLGDTTTVSVTVAGNSGN